MRAAPGAHQTSHLVALLPPVLSSSIGGGTRTPPGACAFTMETCGKLLLLLGVCTLVLSGCQKHPQTDYSALDQSGMWSSSLDEVKTMKPSDLEIAQLTKLKHAGASDDLCLALVKAAHAHNHEFTNADSAIDLSRAGYYRCANPGDGAIRSNRHSQR